MATKTSTPNKDTELIVIQLAESLRETLPYTKEIKGIHNYSLVVLERYDKMFLKKNIKEEKE